MLQRNGGGSAHEVFSFSHYVTVILQLCTLIYLGLPSIQVPACLQSYSNLFKSLPIVFIHRYLPWLARSIRFLLSSVCWLPLFLCFRFPLHPSSSASISILHWYFSVLFHYLTIPNLSSSPGHSGHTNGTARGGGGAGWQPAKRFHDSCKTSSERNPRTHLIFQYFVWSRRPASDKVGLQSRLM